MSLDVLLVTMPWSSLYWPSIQLGTLQPLLEREGLNVRTLHLNLRFAEFCVERTQALPPAERLSHDHFIEVSESRFVGEWIFSVPPFRATDAGKDREFLELLAAQPRGVDPAVATSMRELAPAFLELCANEIAREAPRAVGFTVTFSQTVPSLALAKLLKVARPETTIVFGGSSCDGPMGAALHRAFPCVDVVVRGEAERVAPRLMKEIVAGREIPELPGVCFRRGGRPREGAFESDLVKMDEVPCPDYREYYQQLEHSPLRAAILPALRIPFESARGCWWGEKNHCTFCGLNGSTMKFRSKPSDRTFREMQALSREYRNLRFHIVDNIIDLQHVRDLLPRLRDSGEDWDIFYETKANLKKAELRLFRESGVRAIQPGIESLSTPILRLMKKGVTALQNIRLLKWCSEIGIEVGWNLIMGFPGEEPDEYAKMAQVIPSLVHLQAPSWTGLSVDRFSPYQRAPGLHGITITGPDPAYALIYPELDPQVLSDLAYTFAFEYNDGRNPATYTAAARDAVQNWRAIAGDSLLQYQAGAGFLTIDDQRATTAPAHYTFDDTESFLYLRCDAGATPSQLQKALAEKRRADLTADEIRTFLDELVELRLLYEESGTYLSLALPADPKRSEWREAAH